MLWPILVLVLLGLSLWGLELAVRYSANRTVVQTPKGNKIETLIHRDGAFIQTRGEATGRSPSSSPSSETVGNLGHGRSLSEGPPSRPRTYFFMRSIRQLRTLGNMLSNLAR